ncbi:MAG: hypothetical protein ACTHZX_06530 [Microbacterium sp.]
MSDERSHARRLGGDLWEGARDRRQSMRLVGFEALLAGVASGLIAGIHYELGTATGIGVGIVGAILVVVLLNIPIVGVVFGVALSAFWGLIAFAIGNLWSLFLAIVLGIVIFLASLGAHLASRG